MSDNIKDITKESDIYKTQIKSKQTFPSKFYQTINDKAFLEIETQLSKGCINKPSIYDICKKRKINGLNICVLEKGEYLYKTMLGFITPEMEEKFLRTHQTDLLWFGNIYIAYRFALEIWGGINPYKVKEDIILFDYFDPANMEVLLKFIKNKYGENSQMYRNTTLYTGYKMNKNDQLKKILKQSYWQEIWRFNTPLIEPYSALYCDYDKNVEIFNPASYKIKGNYYHDKILLKEVFKDFLFKNGIHGIIRKQIRSTIELYGLTREEIILTGNIVKNKLMMDTTHSYYWKNWNPKDFKIPSNGFIFDMSFETKNQNFQIIKFYLNNNNCDYKSINIKNNEVSILTYNVHNWININASITKEQNFKDIINLIKKIPCHIVLLQEVNTQYINKQTIISKMGEMNYIDYIYAPNGGQYKSSKQSTYIMLFSKIKLNSKNIIDLTMARYKRNCLVVAYKGIKIAGVHLEIGKNIHNINLDPDTRLQYQNENEEIRIKQLNSLTNNDIIVGDFNFDMNDKESKWLRKEKNFGLVDDRLSTNPFGTRTDMLFINLSSNIVATKSITIECNYSDHLPVITDIIKK
jgi:endonuclease/exonuclease/phosphatase family metal-dependent hydrolase